jgi:mannose-1-phosphate guanylyltransferase/mannose-6-phosphate isomerase
LVFSQGRLVTALGLDNVVIVDTPDALLVADKSQVESVKELVATLKAQGRPEQEYHRKVHRPWGSYEVLDERPAVKVKRLLVNPGAAISLQKHHHRAEHWVVVKGVAQVTRGEESMTLHEFESVNVPVGVVHRLENLGSEPLEVIEVQAGTYLGEDDIVRLEDHWGRQET